MALMSHGYLWITYIRLFCNHYILDMFYHNIIRNASKQVYNHKVISQTLLSINKKYSIKAERCYMYKYRLLYCITTYDTNNQDPDLRWNAIDKFSKG